MVDAFVQGMKALPSRINPQSLNPIAFNLLRDLRQSFLLKKSAGSWVGQKIVEALNEAQKTQAEKFLAIMVEIVTVVLLAARDARVGLEPVFRYIILGGIRSMEESAFSSEKLGSMLEQLLVGVFMTPAYDYQYVHYKRLALLTKRLLGEINAGYKYGKFFSMEKIMKINQGLNNGFYSSLEIIDVDALQKEELRADFKKKYINYFGYYDLLKDWLWLKDPIWAKKVKEYLSRIKEKITFKKRNS
ncbi:hypothetical protein ACFL5G_02630 [Candidatus Margulisiibacteriota bacterium]